MFDFFGFDPRTLSDDDLAAKLAELQGKVVYASRFSSPGLLESLQQLLGALQYEQHERLMRRAAEMYDKSLPDVIESDPDLSDKKSAPSKGPGKITPQNRPRVSIARTSKPTDPTAT